jgi:hypothetical protein
MKRRLACFVATAAVMIGALAIVPVGAFAHQQTTAPGYNFTIHVTISATGVVLDRSVVKRGWLAHFLIHNETKKPVIFEVGGLLSKSIAPGKFGKVGAYCDTRGQYTYKVNNVVRGYFQVV